MAQLEVSRRRTGSFVSRWYRVPDTLRGKVEIAVRVSDAEKVDPANVLTMIVERSPDGVTAEEYARATWVGNNKAAKPGWPANIPALRIGTHAPLLDPQTGVQVGEVPVLPGQFVRLRVEVPKGLTYAIDVTEVV